LFTVGSVERVKEDGRMGRLSDGTVDCRDGTVPGLLAAAVAAFGDRDAYVEIDRRLSFAQLERAAAGVASVFAAAGVGRGDVVCLMLPTSIEYAVCYQAALRLGAITSGINPRLGAPERESIVRRLQPVVSVVEDGDGSLAGGGVGLQRHEIQAAFDEEPAPFVSRRSPTDPVAVVWTSGTTSEPKGAVYDHTRLRAMAAGAGPMSAPGDRRLYPLPFAHSGYMTRLWDEFSNGITSVLTPPDWKAEQCLELIQREAVTVGQGVPTQWTLMLRHPRFAATDFSSMRIAGMGASRIPAELVREMQERIGCPVVVRYTSTEACVTSGTDPADLPETVAETVGRPVPGVQVALVGDDGRLTDRGSVGEIRVRSAAVMRGYWRDPERTAAVLDSEGWLSTGDLAYEDADGNLRIVGRRSDMYIRGGYNVYPLQVEQVISLHPQVADVAVLGMPDEVLGEIGVAVVVPASTGEGAAVPSLATLRDWCCGQLADYKAPDRLVVLDSLPRTGMQKLDRRALLDRLNSAEPAGSR
jgi:acyl-CoA synthetase (AMP-forming)/AMP-acid ligase II